MTQVEESFIKDLIEKIRESDFMISIGTPNHGPFTRDQQVVDDTKDCIIQLLERELEGNSSKRILASRINHK